MDVELFSEAGESGEGAAREIWILKLSNEEKNVHLHAKIEIIHSPHRLLSQESYKLLECDGIAVDHGCIITQALLYLRKQLIIKCN